LEFDFFFLGNVTLFGITNHSLAPICGPIQFSGESSMSKKFHMLLASCLIASSLTVFAQDTTTQDDMKKNDAAQSDM
jgi:hypothetical protein